MSQIISLTPRLKAIADKIPKNSLLSDIGTDHGYLPLYLLQKNHIQKAIAADLNKGPLERAKSLSTQYKIPLDLRLCDGLSAIAPEETNTITIAGMGGITISKILQNWTTQHPHLKSSWKGTFFLQPMSTQYDLRTYLTNSGFSILQEETIQEEKTLYSILTVQIGETPNPPYTDAELWLGRHTPETPDPLRHALLDVWIDKTTRAISSLPPNQETRLAELTTRKNTFESMKNNQI